MNEKLNFMNWDNLGVALITGASSGIGAEFARQLADQGFDLILVARRKEKLNALSKELQLKFSINAEVMVADLSIPADNDMMVSEIKKLENLDVLINNAGFGIMNTFLGSDLKKIVDMINVHFTSPVMFCHAAIPVMSKRKRGVIINTASMAIFNQRLADIMYSNTKAAITLFSEQLQRNIRGTGIYIQSLCPGLTTTEFHDTDSMRGFQRDMVPPEQWMTAEEVVSLSLASMKSRDTIFIPGEHNLKRAKKMRKTTVKKYLDARIL